MYTEETFIARLIGFGLSEKEARLYFKLLKYGPKPSSTLTKSLKTYREDIHRTLNSLIDKGMVKPSLDAPTVYAAADLNAALESALKKQESELREMEVRKRELEELSTHHNFQPSNGVTTFKIIKSIKELVSVELPLAKSAQEEILMVIPQQLVNISSLFGVTNEVGKFIARGGSARGVTDFSYSGVELMQEMQKLGGDWRHFDKYRGITFIVTDGKTSLTSINLDIHRISLNERIAVLWSDDPTYAEYLRGTFDVLWNQSIPSAQRIQELEQVEQQRLP